MKYKKEKLKFKIVSWRYNIYSILIISAENNSRNIFANDIENDDKDQKNFILKFYLEKYLHDITRTWQELQI